MTASVVPRWAPPVVLGAVVALAGAPLLVGRYAFFLDMAVGPGWEPFAPRFYGFHRTAYGGSLPLWGLLSGVARIAGAGVAQKLLLLALLVTPLAAGYLAPDVGRGARLYCALVLLVNPFVYARLLAGQWAVVWGLATLPLALVAVSRYLAVGGRRSLAVAVGTLTLLGFSGHLLYASTVLFGSLAAFHWRARRSRVVPARALTLVAVAVPVNAYWLVPALFAPGAGDGGTGAGLLAYAPRVEAVGGLFTTASMHGFWRGGYVTATDLVPAAWALYVPVLLLAVYGAVAHARDETHGPVVGALVVTAAVMLLLGAGVSGPAAGLVEWLSAHVPLFAGLRDTNKLVAFLVLAYAYLGALGVSRLLHVLDGTTAVPLFAERKWEHVDERSESTARRWVAPLTLALLLAVPVGYAFPMVSGYAGQASAGDYPDDWYDVERTLATAPGDGSVLVLPWHRYVDYDWVPGERTRVGTPARAFFSRPVIQGDNVEFRGVYSTSDDPVSRAVETLFGLGPGRERPAESDFGELLAHVGVQYVLVQKEVDWRGYDAFLADQRSLALVHDGPHLRLYRNDHRVTPGYRTGRLAAVDDWAAFAALTRDRDTLGAAYVFDGPTDRRAPDVVPADSVRRTSPVRYRVGDGPRFAVVRLRQRAAGPGWRAAGDPPVARHLGVHPVFDVRGPAAVRYAPFYRVYLPSYAVSALAVLGLAGFVAVGRFDRTRRPLVRGTAAGGDDGE